MNNGLNFEVYGNWFPIKTLTTLDRLSMKKHIFALLAMTTALFSAANAEDGLYAGGFGGINFVSMKEGVGVQNGIRTGFLGGVCLGYKMDNLRAEGEISYRVNPVKFHSMLKFDGSRTTTTLMANAYYDFDIGTEYMPYVGFGAGYAHNRIVSDIKNGGSFTYTNKFAYQIMGGVHYKVNDKVQVGIEYKYLASEKDTQNHTTSASIKRYF